MKNKSLENIPNFDALKLIIICLLTVVLVLFLRNWYLKKEKLEREIPVLSDVVTHQIKANELNNFVIDADSAVIYLCASNTDTCRNLDLKMKTFIQKNSLEDTIIYLDLKEVVDVSRFYADFNRTYNSDVIEYPTLIYFENASVRKILSGKDMTIEKIEEFLKGLQLIS